MLKLLGELDDRFVDEAGAQNADELKKLNIRNKKRKRRIVTLVCAAILLTVAMLWLFVPYRTTPPSVSKYNNSTYYDLICTINVMTYEKPRYKNNFDMICRQLSSIGKKRSPTATAPYVVDEEIYSEVTDNQVEGVIEADLFKRSDKYIYYLDTDRIVVYSINGIESAEVGSYELRKDLKAQKYGKCDFFGIYLSKDCKTLYVLGNNYYDGLKITALISYDVSNPAAINKIDAIYFSGSYFSSRMINGKITVVTKSEFYRDYLDFDNKKTFLPYTIKDQTYDYLKSDEIVMAQNPTNATYLSVFNVDTDGLEVTDKIAYLSYSSDNMYVTNDKLYLSFTYYDTVEILDVKRVIPQTEISCVDIGDKFTHMGTVCIDGKIDDRYSMDEYDGILRVFTTTTRYRETYGKYVKKMIAERVLNADLYCIDVDTFEIAASVKSFAPEGESVKSARFDKNMAYVCTSVELTDPVFFFDLTDIQHITYTDTGIISGLSTSLVNFKDGYLLGIGVGDRNTLKIEVYKQGEEKVESVSSFELIGAGYSFDYHSYYIDRENGFVGLGIKYYKASDYREWEKYKDSMVQIYGVDRSNYYGNGIIRYLLLKFDGEKLVPVVNSELGDQQVHVDEQGLVRATLIDGYLYTVTRFGLFVQRIPQKFLN